MKTDLSNARIVLREGDDGSSDLHVRHTRSSNFLRVARHYHRDGWENASTNNSVYRSPDELAEPHLELTVLASFPEPTIEEIVGDAQVFRFGRESNFLVAEYYSGAHWCVSGHNDTYSTLARLGHAYGIDLTTIVPLITDPDYVEARR